MSLTEKQQDDYIAQLALELERTGGIVTMEDIEDFGTGRAAVFKVIIPIPTEAPHYHEWELINDKTMLVRCHVCKEEGYK